MKMTTEDLSFANPFTYLQPLHTAQCDRSQVYSVGFIREVSRGFPQFFQLNAWISRSVHDSFLPDPLQFIIHYLFYAIMSRY
jgi:hypothetical protein